MTKTPEMNQRYKVVSDGSEFSVWDAISKCDLFPTRTQNRTYACKYGCPEHAAQMICDALNKSTEAIRQARREGYEKGVEESAKVSEMCNGFNISKLPKAIRQLKYTETDKEGGSNG